MDEQLIISVSEARKLLGKRYKKYSDEYIEQLIKSFDALIETYYKSVPKY